MSAPIRLILALHNHQPVGNFDGVFEQAYQDSYRPFLDVFERFESLRCALHTSGSLIEWLDAHHPEYLDRLAGLVAAGRIEIVGGAFYEPILTMLPRRDRQGQIRTYTTWLEDRLGARIRGMWIPERVWEQSLVSDVAAAGIEYTVLDDFHFKNAGLVDDQLHSYFLTEDEGHLLKVFPGSEQLRYFIPFADPHRSIDYLREVSAQHPHAVVMFADDGEKFGTWPGTREHVYDNGWLEQFFGALVENQDWIQTCTPAEVIDSVPPAGKIYLSDSSYREMTEWALPVKRQVELERLTRGFQDHPDWSSLRGFIRGGLWRNFKVKYPETDEMYARMLMTSRRLQEVEQEHTGETLEAARRELYRGQCNCSYWHGAFGGVYLPHLRNAVYNHLIAADNLLDQVEGRQGAWIEGAAGDYNLDARQEICLSNDRLITLIAPTRGGQIYELDVRSICHNLLATLARRPEAYHSKVLAGPTSDNGSVESIHDRVVFKQEGLNERIQYDTYPRKSLLDHFFDNEADLASVVRGEAGQCGDFLQGVFESRLRRNPQRIQALLTRNGNVNGHPVRLTKKITLEAGSSELELQYQLEGLPPGQTLHLAVEFNFAGLPSGADDRFFHTPGTQRLGHLGTQLDLTDAHAIAMTDQWLGITVQLDISQPSGIWTYPVETVSQSEGGFELVHQSIAVLPHWYILGDESGRWNVTMKLAIDTSVAERRAEQSATAHVG